jgi:hypothetical protein
MALTHSEVAELKEASVALKAMAEVIKGLRSDLYAASDDHDMFEVVKRLCMATSLTAKVAGDAIGKIAEAL